MLDSLIQSYYPPMVDKTLVFQKLIAELSENLKHALHAAKATYDIATHEDNKAENKYDTRGLEASYLAGAQAERVRDLKEALGVISGIQLKSFSKSDKISLSALLKVEFNGKENWLFLLPNGGGQSLVFNGQVIKVITPESPLGELLLGKYIDDSVILNGKEYVIQEIL